MFDLGSYDECRVVGEGSSTTAASSVSSELICKTMFAWREAVSPHLAAERESGLVSDSTVLQVLQRCLQIGLEGRLAEHNVFSVVETAGGVASPGPSGTLQCDLYRYFVFSSFVSFPTLLFYSRLLLLPLSDGCYSNHSLNYTDTDTLY